MLYRSSMAKKAKENARTVCEGLQDAEIIALSKALSEKCAEVTKAKARLKTDVYPVDLVVRITGDIEIGKAEEQTEKFETSKFLYLALSKLSEKERAAVLAADFEDVDDKTAAVLGAMAALVDKVKENLPMKPTAPKVTAHLATSFIERYDHIAQVEARAAA